MSDAPGKLTRRSALALMGTTSVAVTAVVAPAAAQEPPKSPPTQKYIFGYGSLIQIESRMRTVPKAFAASPAIVKGISRGWYYQAASFSLNPTYLGAVVNENATTNGVIYPVSDEELLATNARVRLYPNPFSPFRHHDAGWWPGTTAGGVLLLRQQIEEDGQCRASHRTVVCGPLHGRLPGGRGDVSAGQGRRLRRAVRQDLHGLEDAVDQRSDFPVSAVHLHACASKIDEILCKNLPDDLFHKITLG